MPAQPPLDPAEAAAVRRAAARHRLPPADRDDLRQHLALAVVAARPRYDPRRGSRGAFAHAVADRAARDFVRARRAAGRDPARVAPADLTAVPDPRGDGHRAADLALDVGELLAVLPPPLRAAARAVMAGRVAGAARALGLPRTTLTDRLRLIRDRYARPGLRDYLPGGPVS